MGRDQTGTPLVTIPAEGQLGPAMRALPTDGMRRFVVALLELGTTNYSRAAAAAGYSTSPKALPVTAHRLAHDERVLAAIHEESTRRLNAGKVMAVSVLLNIAENGDKNADRLKAVDMVLNRTGMHATTEHVVKTQDISATDDAMILRIQQLAQKHGLDPTKLLGSNSPKPPEPVDVEFTEIEGSTEGLEDML